MRYLQIGCQVLLAVVFAWSAVSKARDRNAFERFVDSLAPIVRPARAAAAILVVAELAVLPLVLFLPLQGFAAAGVLLMALTTGVVLVVRRRLDVRCRCFGGARDEPLGGRHIVRNLGLLTIAGTGGLSTTIATDPVESAGIVIAASGALVLASVFVQFDAIAGLFARTSSHPG